MRPGNIIEYLKAHPRLCVIFTSLTIYAILFLSPLHVTLVRFKSVDYSFAVWMDINSNDNPLIDRNKYFVFKWANDEHESFGLKKGDILLKKVGCLPGNTLEKRPDNSFFCDGSYIGQGLTETPKLKQRLSVYPFPESMRVPAGNLFMVGDSPTSYDSRYFGFVSEEQIFGRVLFGLAS